MDSTINKRLAAAETIRQIKPGVMQTMAEAKKSWTLHGKLMRFSVGGVERTVRAYDPGFDGAPAYFDIHGGGFAWGSLEDGNFYCHELAQELGMKVYSLDYPLSPDAVYPSQLDYLTDTIDYMLQNADSFGFDPKRLTIGGRSAGGNLAASLCIRNLDRPGWSFRAQVLDHPWLDLAGVIPEEARYIPEGMRFLTESLEKLAETYADDEQRRHTDVSPVLAGRETLSRLPAAIIQTANLDSLSNDGDLYAQQLREAGVRVIHRQAQNVGHGFTEEDNEAAEEGRQWLIQSLRELNKGGRSMYTFQNSIDEIFSDGLEKRGFYLFCPELFIQILTEEQKKLSLEELKRCVKMPWGAPYLSEVILGAANLLLRIEQDETLAYVDLWSESSARDWLPTAGDGKNGCFMLCRTPEAVAGDEIRPAVLICPGGGYEAVDTVNEGFNTVLAMEERGYRVFMLRYRVAPNRWPEPQKDLALAIKTIRANTEAYRLNPDDLLLMGFSAGGHLVASETLYAQEIDALLTRELERELPQLAAKVQGVSAKANKLSLSYPVVSMTSETHEGSVLALTQGDEALKDKLSIELHAVADYPKTFLWANDDDPEVPPSNAKRLARRLESVGTQVLYCTYPWGGHGVGLGTGTGCEGWIDTMTNWMKEN